MRARSLVPIALLVIVSLAGCSWFGGNRSGNKKESVFLVKAGQCFAAPTSVKAELSSLTETPCDHPHAEEAYAVVPYASVSGSIVSAYPGTDVLATFAQGACAQRFGAYVGVDYLDSKLFFTYLLPSARSWETDADRNVLCFVTTTGGVLTTSVKGSKR